MKVETIFFNENEGTGLTTYLLDPSNEMANALVRPAVLIFPGGGYTMCSDREAEPIAMAYAADGYHAFVLRYSVGKTATWEEAFADANRAMKMIHDNSESWGIDTERLAVVGFSAGGHLACSLATMGQIRPGAAVLGYPCILEEMGNLLNKAVPGLDQQVDEKTPPVFVFTTFDDQLVPVRNTTALLQALEKSGVPFEAHVFYSGAHGLSLAKSHTSSGFSGNVNRNVAKWFELSVAFLKEIFGDFQADRAFHDFLVDNADAPYGLDHSLGSLWENQHCRQVLVNYLPMLNDEKVRNQASGVSVRTIISYAEELLTKEQTAMLEHELRQVTRS